MLEVKLVKSNVKFDGKLVTVRKDQVTLPDGSDSFREVVVAQDSAAIVAVKDGNLFMVQQFRYPIGKELLEIPAGRINKDEDPKKAAQRELREETGYSGDLSYLGKFYMTPGCVTEAIHIYLAKNLKPNPLALPEDETEFLRIKEVPMHEVDFMLKHNMIQDAKTVLGVMLMGAKK